MAGAHSGCHAGARWHTTLHLHPSHIPSPVRARTLAAEKTPAMTVRIRARAGRYMVDCGGDKNVFFF